VRKLISFPLRRNCWTFKMKKLLLILIVLYGLISSNIYAQNTRLNIYETIGWFDVFSTIQMKKKIGLHQEYQWRRSRFVETWQQSLLRVGLNYQFRPNVLFRLGYAWIETHGYGDLPIEVNGKDFTEHRIFQMIQHNTQEGSFFITHRYMLEQRFIGKYSDASDKKDDTFIFTNRMRYMIRVQTSILKNKLNNKAYFAAYDEIFIGFGRNVKKNIFDQNRIGLVLGYQFSTNFKIEAGYLNQIIQFGRQIDQQEIFQHNNGLIVNTYFNFDKKEKIDRHLN